MHYNLQQHNNYLRDLITSKGLREVTKPYLLLLSFHYASLVNDEELLSILHASLIIHHYVILFFYDVDVNNNHAIMHHKK